VEWSIAAQLDKFVGGGASAASVSRVGATERAAPR